LLPSAKCTRPLFQSRTGCGGRPSGWHDIVTCQHLVELCLDRPSRSFHLSKQKSNLLFWSLIESPHDLTNLEFPLKIISGITPSSQVFVYLTGMSECRPVHRTMLHNKNSNVRIKQMSQIKGATVAFHHNLYNW